MGETVFELAAAVQSYDWGVLGKDGSTVSEFAGVIPGFDKEYSADKPYAELWMGTHPSLPSRIVPSSDSVSSTEQGASSTASKLESLSDRLSAQPELLGDTVRKHYGKDDLPFLFKVLAIGKALSIQAHPDKQLAKRLHKEKPDAYKDDNHKPEMAIAITAFSGFCGFRPLQEIADFLDGVPEFKSVIDATDASASEAFLSAVREAPKQLVSKGYRTAAGSSDVTADAKKLQDALKDLFAALMNAHPEKVVKPEVRKLVQRYKAEVYSQEGKADTSADFPSGSIEELVVRLDEQFKNDVGIFCSFVLNVVTLEPGQAIFLKANEPHAYLTGNIVECMATSDNVVRAGLTPKLRDTPTLINMLTYTFGPSDKQLMTPQSFQQARYTKLYDPPIEEFSVALIDLPEGKEETHAPIGGPSIMIVTALEGEARLSVGDQTACIKQAGQVYFIGANEKVTLSGNHLVAYRAFVEV
ncbi:uncharacterized protein L969DRAFT_19764 [Mixia osmundae IAM 14324]|uniref:Mannose-6-phosphate isomerase n=1 Tax=Mixia osmundae (strain CBS 9802 / IAM 14324 / JCM 22182 / KY 12970) TaxID=764103 RepID=G7DS10_MIXOS|nr:uncharacterized protein L969DRAFT_19764 [Mixia osmundae IAM 14324]KEI37229.1 hypothetical protein L969DRAFT_19764 [Mixia osmundae IAM 14324]GAA93370.1 hypothetical protein E5Q_00010 [Mixia osmundae IAM 14324]